MTNRNKKKRNRENPQPKRRILSPAQIGMVHEISAQRAGYADQWSNTNAAKLDADGHYDWMASHVTGARRVLEIGPGDGRGTLALLRAGTAEIIGFDENRSCLQATRKRLESSGHSVVLIKRETMIPRQTGYTVEYDPVSVPYPVPPILLLEGDLVNDPLLHQWLASQPQFDAVICWLMGSHSCRPFNLVFRGLPHQSERDLRIGAEKAAYLLADRVLRHGGVLHVVSRGESLDNPIVRDGFLRLHRDQAAPTSLRVETVDCRHYSAELGGVGIPVGVRASNSDPTPDMSRPSLVCALSRKP